MRNTNCEPRCLLGLLLATLLATRGMADAPHGHFTVVAETVEDSATTLTWQRSVPPKAYANADAAAYCAALDLRGTGWRLPSIKELYTLVDESRIEPAIDSSVFPDTPSDYFWSSSHVANFSIYAWTVSFADGTDLWYPVEKLQHVRCVR